MEQGKSGDRGCRKRMGPRSGPEMMPIQSPPTALRKHNPAHEDAPVSADDEKNQLNF